jgi:hypothetical protein
VYVHKESIGRPSAEDHDLRHPDVVDEKCHCCSGVNRFAPDLGRAESEGRFAAKGVASVPQDVEYVCVSDEAKFSVEGNHIDFGSSRDIWYCA